MAKSKVTTPVVSGGKQPKLVSTPRKSRKLRREQIAEIAERAFRTSFKETLEYSARLHPRALLRTVIDDYLGAMRSQLEWTERREAEQRQFSASVRASKQDRTRRDNG
jgi:hypothetical protein